MLAHSTKAVGLYLTEQETRRHCVPSAWNVLPPFPLLGLLIFQVSD